LDDEAMSKVGVIINPKSGRGRGKGLALAAALENTNRQQVDVVVLNSFDDLYTGLAGFAANDVRDVFISSGDGTIQAIQTWMAESGAFKQLPRLCLLPHGTTNMTAADLGFRRNSIDDQAQFIGNVTPQEVRARPTLRVVNPKGRGPLHGMFFGTGAVSEATRYCQVAFNDKGVGGQWATFATLASVLSKSLFLPPNATDPNRFDKPYPISLKTDGLIQCEGQQLMMLATTLEKLILGTRPFWGGATAPLRTTTLPYPVPSIPRWIWPMMFGSETRNRPTGATSRACHSCEVTCPTPFVIDGEFYDPPTDEPLRLETGPRLDYIVA
jgi:diacylglycerol kinase (ATP)